MEYIVLIGLFALFYLIIFAAVLKSEGISLFGSIADIVFIIILIIFYFVGKNIDDPEINNYFYFMIVGSLVYMYNAVKMFWIKPQLIQYVVTKEVDSENEDLEDLETYLRTARIRSVYNFITSVALMVIILLVNPFPLNDEHLSFTTFIIFITICIFIVSFIIDIIRKIKYGVFFFKSIAPLLTIVWMIISLIVLLKR